MIGLAVHFIATGLLISTAFVCVYHLTFALVALFQHSPEPSRDARDHRFVIVIPAHNEEATIAQTLRCCANLDYPADLVQVFVIADNCSDGTVQVVQSHGAKCLVRTNERDRGKGQALEWGFEQLASIACDAFVILDADCRISPNALRRCSAELSRGARALQVNNRIDNPDESATAFLLALANALENDLFYTPKSALGFAVALRGTGMVLCHEVLAAFPWQARSLAEDTEYGLRLLKAGVAVRFVPDVYVTSACPAASRELSAQRSRWIGGSVQQARLNSVSLALAGLAHRKLLLLDAAVSIWIVNRPLVVAQWLMATLAVGLCNLTTQGGWTQGINVGLAAVTLGYCGYVLLGAVLLGVTTRRLRLLCFVPREVVRYLCVALAVAFRGSPTQWVRAPRPAVLEAADSH